MSFPLACPCEKHIVKCSLFPHCVTRSLDNSVFPISIGHIDGWMDGWVDNTKYGVVHFQIKVIKTDSNNIRGCRNSIGP